MKKVMMTALILLVVLGLAAPVSAQASLEESEPTGYVEIPGTVTTIDLLGGVFILTDAEGNVYTVSPMAGYDLAQLSSGDTVLVAGTLEGGALLAERILRSVRLVGTVGTIDLAGGGFQFQAEDGTLFNVVAPPGYNLETLAEGDTIVVIGMWEGDTILASGLSTLFPGDGEGVKEGFYCQNLGSFQPTGLRLSTTYGLFYQEVMSWFCVNSFGFGEIKNALRASQMLGDALAPADLLAMKEEMGGWGKIWQSWGLKGSKKESLEETSPEIEGSAAKQNQGKSKHNTPPGQEKKNK